ncbi:hypothetical protein IscW_ISCW007113 [Ixodes scapularis]|uniref:Uncharacterized protein n=1 Tax=Ixodes scapularis TaxID=6945 RepID=B7PTR1_IXOSC|nr:hypothetical protein IscW_ISCW007113 [Ixodes scapularis]|eukprot:XP_002404783.1 hypothetical protein IscW_ISCW007113 [Ixodes scapularis]
MPRALRTLHRQTPESQCSPRGGSTRKPTSSTTATTLLRDRVSDPIASAIGHCPRSRDPQETASPFLSPWPWLAEERPRPPLSPGSPKADPRRGNLLTGGASAAAASVAGTGPLPQEDRGQRRNDDHSYNPHGRRGRQPSRLDDEGLRRDVGPDVVNQDAGGGDGAMGRGPVRSCVTATG